MAKFALSFYIVLLGTLIGMIAALGMLTAPVVFHPELCVGPDVLTRFQSGLLMTSIFLKFNGFLDAMLLVIAASELYIQVVRRIGCLVDAIAAGAVVACGSYFTFYLTPRVLEFQAHGQSVASDPAFQMIHKLSELDFKFLLASLVMLIFIRLSRFQSLCEQSPVSGGCAR